MLRWLKLNYSSLKRDSYRFGSIRDGQLAENTADVELDRTFSDIQRRRDFSIPFSADEQSQDVEFARRES